MTLKLATKDDLPRLHELFREFLQHSPYRTLKYDYDKVQTLFLETIDNREAFLYLVDVDELGLIQGFLLASKIQTLFSIESIGTEIAWWIEPLSRNFKTAVKMLDAYEYWAKLVGCKFASLAHLANGKGDTLTKWYNRRGYTLQESAFIKEMI